MEFKKADFSNKSYAHKRVQLEKFQCQVLLASVFRNNIVCVNKLDKLDKLYS